MTEATDMQPEIKKFFNDALPKNQGEHVLTIGEFHHHRDHTDYLNQHLTVLIRDHVLGTIGIEMPTYINVVLWAYADKKLERMLGSQEKAASYVRAMFEINSEVKYTKASEAWADLAMKAIDNGVRVVAFDCRMNIKEELEYAQDCAVSIKWHVDQHAANSGRSEKDILKQVFLDKPFRNQIVDEIARDELQQEIDQNGEAKLKKLIAKDGYKTLDGYLQDTIVTDVRASFGLAEIQRMLKKNPHYGARLSAMETIVSEGMKRQPPIPSDALSAAILSATSVPHKNTITLNGFSHIDGIGSIDEPEPIEVIHGTFHKHLESIQRDGRKAPIVTRAILATTAVAKEMRDEYTIQRRHGPLLRETNTPIIVMLDKGQVTSLPLANANHPKLVSFANKISGYHSTRHRNSSQEKSRADPLLIPDIKQAHDDVCADWNPTVKDEIQR